MLAKMFSGEMRPGDKDEDRAYIIDRSPDYFKPILNYFRTGKVIIDYNINVEGVLEEAKYYGIDSLIPLLQDLNGNVSEVKRSKETQNKDSDEVLRKAMELLSLYKQLYPVGGYRDSVLFLGREVFDEIERKLRKQIFEIGKKL